MKIATETRLTSLKTERSECCKVIKITGFNEIGMFVGTKDCHIKTTDNDIMVMRDDVH